MAEAHSCFSSAGLQPAAPAQTPASSSTCAAPPAPRSVRPPASRFVCPFPGRIHSSPTVPPVCTTHAAHTITLPASPSTAPSPAAAAAAAAAEIGLPEVSYSSPGTAFIFLERGRYHRGLCRLFVRRWGRPASHRRSWPRPRFPSQQPQQSPATLALRRFRTFTPAPGRRSCLRGDPG